MKAKVLCLLVGAALLALPGNAASKDVVLPAGTLLTCTMEEPNFSSATVTVGDPFICHPRALQMFGQSVFPRGSYLVGHLLADKDPGHFVGKGYLQLAFDRIGLADNDLPLSAKVIAVHGYKVDREGRVIGHGHATRDTVEWLLPPLWPWKVLTLPARGPRPTLKGEVAVTLRVTEDVYVPANRGLDNRLESGTIAPARFGSNPESPNNLVQPSPSPQVNTGGSGLYASEPRRILSARSAADSLAVGTYFDSFGWRRFESDPKTTLFVGHSGMVYAVTQYKRRTDILVFVLNNGSLMTMDMKDVDWPTTMQLNSERGVRINLRNGVLCNGECAGF
jgi:hypothetical protein